MNIGVTEISPRAVQRAAEKNFKSGYYCCEALMSTIRDEFKLDVPKEVIAMSSGMAVGAGKSGCVCGAFNGGLLALGKAIGYLKMPFFPSYAAFTFPFVISAIASKQMMACAMNMGHPMPFLKYVVLIETIIAVVLVVYTYIRFMGFIFGGKK